MQFNLTNVNEKLFLSNRFIEGLVASCKGIISTHITPSNSDWYNVLYPNLKQAQNLAEQYLERSSKDNFSISKNILTCGRTFIASEKNNLLSNQVGNDPISESEKVTLRIYLEELKFKLHNVCELIVDHKQYLQNWNKELEQIHYKMRENIIRFQKSRIELQTQIGAINNKILSLEDRIINLRIALANKELEREKLSFLETIFSFPISAITSGIGIASTLKIEAEISEIEKAIDDCWRYIQYNCSTLKQEEIELLSLNNLLIPADIILKDINSAEQVLDEVRISFELFTKEIDDIIIKISNAQDSDTIKIWFDSAYKEWKLITNMTQNIIEASRDSDNIAYENHDITYGKKSGEGFGPTIGNPFYY